MQLEFPDKIFEGTNITAEDIRLDVAVSMFDRELVSIGKAAQIAGMNRWDFQKILFERKIPVIRYSIEDELKGVEAFRKMENKS